MLNELTRWQTSFSFHHYGGVWLWWTDGRGACVALQSHAKKRFCVCIVVRKKKSLWQRLLESKPHEYRSIKILFFFPLGLFVGIGMTRTCFVCFRLTVCKFMWICLEFACFRSNQTNRWMHNDKFMSVMCCHFVCILYVILYFVLHMRSQAALSTCKMLYFKNYA